VKASTAAGASKTHDFLFTLVDPCLSLTLSHQVSLFTSSAETYKLGDPAKSLTWSQSIASKTPDLQSCGDFGVEIYYDDPNDSLGVI